MLYEYLGQYLDMHQTTDRIEVIVITYQPCWGCYVYNESPIECQF